MPLNLSKRQLIILGGGVVLIVVILSLIFLNMRAKPNTAAEPKLTVWGTETASEFAPIADGYPYATVTYIQVDPSNYRSQLLAALAAGTGPDVFEISNRELPLWQSVLAPMPATYAQSFGPLQLAQTFPDVVAEDFVSGSSTYGLPLSIDTLAMVYNKDLFNSAGIAVPPKTWDQFDADVDQLRAVNSSGQITQAAAAIGGSETSIPNATDLISLLMLQNGTEMTNSGNTIAEFASNGTAGQTAFNFYLQFANAASPYYTWNDSMGNAFDSFVAGQTAIIFAYESDLATIEAKAPFLNVGIAPMPQPTGATVAVNYPNYSGFVAAKAGQVSLAWNFILYLTTSDAIEKMYVTATGKPPAQRIEIQADENDPNLSVFATQALTAKSWYEADDTQIDSAFNTAIQSVLDGAENSTQALSQAQAAVNALMVPQQQ
jgi:ABC-type glycerol-3-phosphate transport system substrate-binding protein